MDPFWDVTSMDELIKSGLAADIVLGVMSLEAICMTVFLRRSALGAAVPGFLAALLAGTCLVLALRSALTGAGYGEIAIFLGLSLLAHLGELGLKIHGLKANPNQGSQT